MLRTGIMDAAVASLVDVLGAADALRTRIDPAMPRIETVLVAEQAMIRSASGQSLERSATLDALESVDVVAVPALASFSGSDVIASLESAEGRTVVDAARRLGHSGRPIAGACNGVFVLAEAGLLRGRRATTTWYLDDEFRARFPNVELDTAATLVTDGNVITAGAGFAHIDLALAMVRTLSLELASLVGRTLLIDERSCESAYVVLEDLTYGDPLVAEFEREVRASLQEAPSVATIAARLGASRRTIERRVGLATGATPNELIRRVRVQRARYLRRTTEMSSEQIAHRVGYANGSTLRAVERQLTTG